MRSLRMLMLVLLAGLCAVTTVPVAHAAPKGYVMSEWSFNMREMGIVPVFPPREDLQVGDLYVYRYNPESEETEKRMRKGDREIGMSPRWGSIQGIIEAAAKEYEGRLSLPSLTVDPLKADPMKTEEAKSDQKKPDDSKGITTLPNTGDKPVYVADSKPNRLRQVAFPEFMSANFSQGNLSAIIPVEVINLALGAGWSRSKSVTMKIPSAESYAVPQQVALRMLLDMGMENGRKVCYLKEQYRDLLETLPTGIDSDEVKARKKRTPPATPAQYWWIRVPVEVYYARAMDVSVESKSSSGGRIGASLLNPAAFAQALKASTDQAANAAKQPEKKPDQNGSGTTNSGTSGSSTANPMNGSAGGSGNNQSPMNGGQQGNGTQPNGGTTDQAAAKDCSKDTTAALLALLDPAAAAYARAQALNTFLQSSGNANVPGGFVQFVNASDSAIGMRRTWERPIAIGYRCLTLRIEPGTYKVSLIGNGRSALPSVPAVPAVPAAPAVN